ncbi:hypothetical protein [Actinoplanes sp. NPDC051411]|uniref:hypothetical protein n=1 Tax=Actinoplanes sp. NPDC051411 TaxID=3155522 RepID=UPI003441E1D3
MTDIWQTAAAAWGTRPDFRTEGSKHRDCPGNDGGGTDGGGGTGTGGGGTGTGGGGTGTGGGSGGGGVTGNGCGCGGCGDGCGCEKSFDHHCGCEHCDRPAPCGCEGHRHHHHGHHGHHGPHRPEPQPEPGAGPGYHDNGTTIGWRNPRRPGRHVGRSTGRLPGGVLDPCDFGNPPWNQWPGDRGDLYLPFLFMRANPGDLGARPVAGPFWESPDVLLLADTDPALAPPKPPELGQTALAGRPNTLYAHVWNFGLSSAPCVVVEFYWCDPSLGIGPAGAHLIGATSISLGARGSGRSHAVAKCPTAWVPTFVNGGHECLVVRAWDEAGDGLGTPPWDAALNRHVAQRNIHVVPVPGAHAADDDRLLALPTPMTPLTLKVGPLYGEPAQVTVARAAPHEMPWLQLRTGTRGLFPAQATATGAVAVSGPSPIGGGPSTGGPGTTQDVTGEDQQLQLTTTDAPPKAGEAHVYRVTASQQGQVFGGYTVVLLG